VRAFETKRRRRGTRGIDGGLAALQPQTVACMPQLLRIQYLYLRVYAWVRSRSGATTSAF